MLTPLCLKNKKALKVNVGKRGIHVRWKTLNASNNCTMPDQQSSRCWNMNRTRSPLHTSRKFWKGWKGMRAWTLTCAVTFTSFVSAVRPFVRWHRGSGIASAYHRQTFFKVALGAGICETGKRDFPLGLKWINGLSEHIPKHGIWRIVGLDV
jgi:hypothetical protein